jgi:hypothetical protein
MLATGRSVGVARSCRSVGSSLVGPLPVGAPFPARAARCPPRDPGLACVPAGSPRPVALRAWLGWVHYRTVGVRGRPSPTRGHARSRRDRRRCGCHATGCGPDPPHITLPQMIESRPPGLRRGQVRDQQERGTSRRGAAQVPIPLITPQVPGAASGRERDHSQSSGTQIAVVSSGTGVPPRRGRPPGQPHDSVVHPTRPLP